MEEHWTELELTVTDARDRRATRHVEYKALSSHPEVAAQEVVRHLLASVGPDRLRAAGPDRTVGEGPGRG